MTSDPTPSQYLKITGTVQGVGYREAMRRQAMALNIAGWCRNNPDGTVSAWIAGPPEALVRLVAWCREGPPQATVTDVLVDTLSLPPDVLPLPFEIRR